jgi:hypothetical protein
MPAQQDQYFEIIDKAQRRETTPLEALKALAAAIDRRFQAIEALNPVWRDQIATLTTLGLQDIDQTIAPVLARIIAQAETVQDIVDAFGAASENAELFAAVALAPRRKRTS